MALALRRLATVLILAAAFVIGAAASAPGGTDGLEVAQGDEVDVAPLTDAQRAYVSDLASRVTFRVAAEGCRGSVVGSGFAVDLEPDRRVLVTNSHVVGDASVVRVDQPANRHDPYSGPTYVEGNLVSKDLAVVDTGGGLALLPASLLPGVGEPVMLVGYGGGGRRLAVVDATVHQYVNGSLYGSDGTVMLVDGRTVKGFSGGPVLNRRGEVVAVLRAFEPVTGLSVAIPISEVGDATDGFNTVGIEAWCN